MSDNLLAMKGPTPKHIAIIMDGNRRWARRNRVAEIEGHRKGVEALLKTVEEVGKLGIKYLTVYALSSENYENRSREEIKGLLQLLKEGYNRHLPRLKKEGVRLDFIGDLEKLPKPTKFIINKAKVELADGKKSVLNLAINYGSRGEIVGAAKRLAEKNLKFLEKTFEKELYTSGIPDPDLLIRTGGVRRLSNFLLWQISYAELFFTDNLWPDFDRNELLRAIEYFRLQKRNFGA